MQAKEEVVEKDDFRTGNKYEDRGPAAGARYHMRILLIYLYIILSGFNYQGRVAYAKKWVITSGCSLKVDGKTNVNEFSCAITNYSQPDTIWASWNNNQPVKLSGSIHLDVQRFDCHNAVMTADLRKTLKSKEYPKLGIRFLSLAQYPEAGSRQKKTKGVVVIELAGVSKRYEVDYSIVSAADNYINLVGSREVNFSDFDIQPPRKLGGMIRTENELSVVFNLRMKVID